MFIINNDQNSENKHKAGRERIQQILMYSLAVFFLLLFSQCKKDDDNIWWDISASGPLLSTRLDLSDIFPDSIIKTDCSLQAFIYYEGVIYRFSADSLFQVREEISNEVYRLPVTFTLQPGQQFISSNQLTKFDFNDAFIRRMDVKQGSVKISIVNTITQPLVCRYTIPKASKNGQIFSRRISMPAATTGNVSSKEFDVDISGYTVDLSGPTSLSANQLKVIIDVIIDSSGSAVTVTPNDSLYIKAEFEQLDIGYADGYFGSFSSAIGPEISNIEVFKYFENGTFDLSEAHASIKISNGFGVDISVLMDSLFVLNTSTGAKIYLNDPVIGLPVSVARASKSLSPPPLVYPVEYTFDLNSKSIETMIEAMPDRLGYALSFEFNPLGNTSSGNDFYYKQHPIVASYLMQIPLYFSAKGLTFKDRVDFHFEDDNINNGKLFIIADNLFPFQSEIELVLLDDNKLVIDSITGVRLIEAADTLPDGTTKLKRTIISVDINTDDIQQLKRTKFFDVIAIFKTLPEDQPVKLRSNYYMDLKISANLQYLLKL